MDLINSFFHWFWSPSVWLPPGKNWDDMKSTDHLTMPEFEDLYPSAIFITAFFIMIRYLVIEPFFIKPVGKYLGVKYRSPKKPLHNPQLEKLFLENKMGKVPLDLIVASSLKLGWTEIKVQRWLRQRKASAKATDMLKFCDCIWQLFYYVAYCIFGFFVLYDKPWVWDIRNCWINYPFQNFYQDIWWYYMIPLGFYLASTLTFLLQYQRKDAFQMLLHHVVTLILIIFSWAVNLVRAGTLILLVHECADIPLLLAKASGYIGKQHWMDRFFVVFIILWLVTRIGLFPFWIIRSAIFDSYVIIQLMYPIYYLFNGLLLILLAFHIMWTIFIIRIIINKFKFKETKDVRSSSDEMSESCEENDFQLANGIGQSGEVKKDL